MVLQCLSMFSFKGLSQIYQFTIELSHGHLSFISSFSLLQESYFPGICSDTLFFVFQVSCQNKFSHLLVMCGVITFTFISLPSSSHSFSSFSITYIQNWVIKVLFAFFCLQLRWLLPIVPSKTLNLVLSFSEKASKLCVLFHFTQFLDGIFLIILLIFNIFYSQKFLYKQCCMLCIFYFLKFKIDIKLYLFMICNMMF